MAFSWEPRLWPNVGEFKKYLATIHPPSWLKGVTFHNTASPDRAQWRGMEHVKNLGFYYEHQVQNPDGSRGWPSGPHLFLAGDTHFNGIFQGTPLLVRGTHAGPCNSSRLGIEIVGNYSVEDWPPATAELVYGVLQAVCEWATIPVKEVWAHRECMPGHTSCPGTHINPDAVRAELFRRRQNTVPGNLVTSYLRIIGTGPSCTVQQFWSSIARHMPTGTANEPLLSEDEAHFLYAFAVDQGVDPGAVLGIWAQEQGLPYGSTALGKLSRNPFNIRAPDGDWRWTVDLPNKTPRQPFYAYESWKIGLLYCILHLKNFYGGFKHLYTLEEIIEIFAPRSDGNDPTAYVKSVKGTMAYIASQ